MKIGNTIAFVLGALAGGLAGLVAGLLMAPQSGDKTQAGLRARSLALKDKADQAVADGRHSLEATVTNVRNEAAHSVRRGAAALQNVSRKIKAPAQAELDSVGVADDAIHMTEN